MSDLRDPTSATEADSLHNLYRMSRTAGLGSGDYVAINNVSIMSLLLGLASVLSLLYPFMLLLALTAAICGVIALVQIYSSNGTQSGRGFAALGILLALGLGGVAGGKIVIEGIEKKRDSARVGEVVARMSDLIAAKEYSKAYQTLFSESFKKDFTEQEFANRWEAFTPHVGGVKKIGWGERAEFETIRATNTKKAYIQSTIEFEKVPDPGRQSMTFVLADGEWMIDGVGQMFERAKDEKKSDGGAQMPDPSQPLGPDFQLPGGPPAP